MSKKILKIKTSEIKTRVIWCFNPDTRVNSTKKANSRKNYKIPSH
jgi:hypothetical protein